MATKKNKKRATKKKAAKAKAKAKGKPATVDEYLATVPAAPRAALQSLRKVIRSAAPDATEKISYGICTFNLHGGLVGFAAFPKHCSFFLMSVKAAKDHEDAIAPYVGGKGTLHFAPNKPLPSALIKKLVKARIAENVANARSSRP